MEEVPDFFKALLSHFQIIPIDEGTWVNVAKLSSEDILKKKNHDMQSRRLASEGRVLYSKLQVIQATMKANNAEFWDGMYKTYNLPADLNYKVDETGQVMKYVPKPPSENA